MQKILKQYESVHSSCSFCQTQTDHADALQWRPKLVFPFSRRHPAHAFWQRRWWACVRKKKKILLWIKSFIMTPKKKFFNRYVVVSLRWFSCQGECLFSPVSEQHKHRETSEGGGYFHAKSAEFLKSGTNLVLFRNQTRYSLSSAKDSPHFPSTRPFKLRN